VLEHIVNYAGGVKETEGERESIHVKEEDKSAGNWPSGSEVGG